MIHVTTRMNPESILSERSQSQNATYHTIPFMWNVKNRQMHRDRKISGARGWEEKRTGRDCSAVWRFILRWWKYSTIRQWDGCTTWLIYWKPLKGWIVCELDHKFLKIQSWYCRGGKVFLDPLRVPGWIWKSNWQRQINRRKAHKFISC